MRIYIECAGNFYEIARALKEKDIRVGVALLPETSVEKIAPAIDDIDHVLIFSGDLGYFGGTAKLQLLDKVRALRALKPELEIGWDGGINSDNASKLVLGGIDVLNTGGAIHKAKNPEAAYDKLSNVIGEVRA